ncbi:hypothetical protein G6O67_003531 [Ophiocordyceps sinensis]|uniref:Uncharacterized protein n=1 Tax=Ophiocordyceps sinensis TaxID=72228 RepID=A0A8H4PS35_9HYPO|nr:hypothetical protein G6O67_003531 [Ophiocordyceps sinensis]
MLGKIFLTLDAMGLLFGAPIADMNETHQYNPRWPPHAKFHNAQTILLSVMLGLVTLYFTWRRCESPLLKQQSSYIAMLCGSLYWLAGCCAPLFPGASGLDPEFGGPAFPQLPIFTTFLGCAVVGGICELYNI